MRCKFYQIYRRVATPKILLIPFPLPKEKHFKLRIYTINRVFFDFLGQELGKFGRSVGLWDP